MSNHLHIVPSNTLSNGKVSFKNGNPVIQFIIGEQDRLLVGQSVRLCGKFRVWKDQLNVAGSVPSDADQISMPGRLGVYSCIDQLVLKSQQTHQVIEHIRHYNRFCSSFVPITHSLQDNMGSLAEQSLCMPNYQLQQDSVVRIPTSYNTANEFCIALPCGLFNGTQNIPLSGTWGLKGLLVEIHLSPDNNVLFAQNGTTTTLTDAFYEFNDLKLVAEAVNPTPEMLKDYSAKGNAFEYNSISSYFTSINSTNAIINFNLGLSRVLGVFCNFIASNRINNMAWDGMNTDYLRNSDAAFTPANITQVVFTRGGVKFPLEYNIDWMGASGTDGNIKQTDAQIQRNYINAVAPFSKLGRTMPNACNTFTFDVSLAAADQNGRGVEEIEGGQNYGVGMAYDNISGDGVDFSSQQWGLNMTTQLTSNNPHACFVFVHSKNTLTFNQNGLQVLS
jgi:hypothetical protein